MSETAVDAFVKRVFLISAGLIVVALSAAVYTQYTELRLTLAPDELHLRKVSPYYSGLPIGSRYLEKKGAPLEIKHEAAYDVKRCTPKALSFGKTPAEIHFREAEKPTGLIPVVAFHVLESGEVTNIVLKQRSGIRDKDNAALN